MKLRIHRRGDVSTAFASAIAILFAGAALADVPDGFWRVVDDKQEETSADVAMAGALNQVMIAAVCETFVEEDSPFGSAILVASDHPDGVKLRKNTGGFEQSQGGNPAIVTLVTGSGEEQTRNLLACEKAEVEAEIKTKKSPTQGSFEAFGKGCSCADAEENECSVFTEQIGILAAKCQRNDSVDVRFSDKDQNLRKFKVKGKGRASVVPPS
jgi:hypothetical protein